MKNEEVTDIVKAAYLTQLRHGPFTAEELGQHLMGDASGQLQNAEYFQRQTIDQGTRYSLTAAGRRLINVVLAGGVYDVLHVGHLAALREAKELGDVLVVVVATDITVEMLKGRKPVLPEEDRRELVEGLKPVDKAILGYEDVGFGFEQVLTEVMPDLVAFGYDQEKLEGTVSEIIQHRNLKITVVKLSRFEREKYASSSSVRQRLAEASK
jgi:cytidyltransferase-like protein